MEPEFKTRTLTGTAQLRSIEKEWIELCQRCPRVTPFQRPEWLISWSESFLPENIRVVEVRSGNRLVGLAPLLIYARGEERVLAFMGGGVSDYLDLLLDPRHESQIARTMFQEIHKLDDWTTLDLTDLPASSILHLTRLAEFANPHDHCSIVPVPETREVLLQRVSKRQRANLRQAYSRMQKAGGATVETSTQETVSGFLNDLFRLHALRWHRDGQSGVLADERVKAFHRKVAPALHGEGFVRFYRLRVSDQTIAIVYTLRDRGTVFCYLQGYDPEYAALSPGTYLIFSAIEDAMISGIAKFDLLRGDEGYKHHWRGQVESTYRIQLPRAHENGVPGLFFIAA